MDVISLRLNYIQGFLKEVNELPLPVWTKKMYYLRTKIDPNFFWRKTPIPTCFEAPNIKHWQKKNGLVCRPPSSVGYFLFLGGVFQKNKTRSGPNIILIISRKFVCLFCYVENSQTREPLPMFLVPIAGKP